MYIATVLTISTNPAPPKTPLRDGLAAPTADVGEGPQRVESTIASRMTSSVYRNGRESTAFQSTEGELTGSGRRDFAVKNLYALQGDAQVLLVSTDEAGLGFSDQ